MFCLNKNGLSFKLKVYFMIFLKKEIVVNGIIGLLIIFSACDSKIEYQDEIYQKPAIVKDPPVDFLSPEASIASMYVPKGFKVELVASEPMINEPVAIAWDPNGKLYVAEMLTYMQDIDGTDQDQPWSRISVLEDENGDGKMDKSTVFIDSLILPRILLPLDDRVIVGETYQRDIWSYRDTDGDRVADEKVLLLADTVRDNSNLEHQSANMMWSIDNWLYLSRDALRYKFIDGTIKIDTLEDAPSGQWGLTEDENGQPFYSSAGGEVPALGYQQHPYYGRLEMDKKWEDGFEQTWPIIGTPDVQGGERRLREDGTLNHFTASCGQSIFLGDKLPAYGDLFIPEPVGRLIRRAKINQVEGKTMLSNAYHEAEFLASTDANFRPVETKTGPDGCLYVVDMYRGIIQEGTWVREGSFLRPVVKRKKLDKNIGKGRIYRIVHNQMDPGQPIKLMDKSSEDLIPFLNHPNGWCRINAQKLIVLRQDKDVVQHLRKAMSNEYKPMTLYTDENKGVGRLHALWTLEGLGQVDESLILDALKDSDPRVRRAALRISESFITEGNNTVLKAVYALQNDISKEVLTQLILSLRSDKSAETKVVIQAIIGMNPTSEVIAKVGEESIKEVPEAVAMLKKKYRMTPAGVRQRIIEGHQIFKNLCASCHGENGEGIGDLAPTLVNSPRVLGNPETLSKILLHGLQGPLDGKEFQGVMVGMQNQDDKWIASVLTYVRKHLNESNQVGPWVVGKVRKKYGDRPSYWTLEELEQDE